MDQLTNLKNKLTRRLKRLRDANERHFAPEIRRFVTFIKSEPMLYSCLQAACSRHYGEKNRVITVLSSSEVLTNPRSAPKEESQLVSLLWNLLEHLDSGDYQELQQVENTSFGNSAPDTRWLALKERLVQPLYDFLLEKLDEQEVLLGTLLRYKTRCEVFNHAHLLNVVKDPEKKDNAKKKGRRPYRDVEKQLKNDLHLYLHDQGVAFQIEPALGRGEVDVVIGEGPDRYYTEAKVFSDDNSKTKILKDFGQTYRYSQDYNCNTIYLVIYNVSGRPPAFQGCESVLGHVQCVRYSSTAVYIMVIDLLRHTRPLSGQGKIDQIIITANELSGALSQSECDIAH